VVEWTKNISPLQSANAVRMFHANPLHLYRHIFSSLDFGKFQLFKILPKFC
jgi:hypothetical protein